MAFVQLPKRVALKDLNSAADINQLQENCDYLRSIVDAPYSPYYVQSTPPSGPAYGTLWYDTTTNKLYKYSGSDWIEIDWQQIIKATPEWQAGKLRISNGMLQIADGQATPIWHDCYPLVGADVCYIKDLTKYYYLHKACIGYGSRYPITFCSALTTTYITYSYPQSMFVNVSGQSCSSNIYYHCIFVIFH